MNTAKILNEANESRFQRARAEMIAKDASQSLMHWILRFVLCVVIGLIACSAFSSMGLDGLTINDFEPVLFAMVMSIAFGIVPLFQFIRNFGFTIWANWIFILVLIGFELAIAMVIGVPYCIYLIFRIVQSSLFTFRAKNQHKQANEHYESIKKNL